MGENLILRVRKLLFRELMYKDVNWFDSKDRAPGVLTNLLSEHISLLNGLTTETISILLDGFLAIIIGIILALIFTWKMGLITLALSPFMIVGGILKGKFIGQTYSGKSGKEAENNYRESNALLSDILMNYRTVIGFGPRNIDYLLTKYKDLLAVPTRKGIRIAHIGGFFYGYTNCMRFLFNGVIYWIAAVLI